MSKKLLFVLMVVFSLLLLAACGGGGESESEGDSGGAVVGDAARGETLYKQTIIGTASAPGCATCHSLEADVVLVGPSHAGVAGRAGSYVAGKSAEDYLHESIVTPDAHVVEGFTAGVMYQNYGNELSEQEIADLVAYLMTLR